MFPKFRLARELSHGAMVLAVVATGAAALVSTPALAKDKKPEAAAAPQGPKLTASKTFLPLAQSFQKAFDAAKKRADVLAAQQAAKVATDAYNAAPTSAARKTAMTQREAALAALAATLTPEKALLDTATAGAVTPDDKFFAGQFQAQFGAASQDMKAVHLGYEAMLATGKVQAADAPRLESVIGQLCYDEKNYACAKQHLPIAIAGNERGTNNELLLADSYFRENGTAQGVDIVLKAIADRKAAKLPYGPEWFGTALNAAFKAKMLPQASAVSQAMLVDFPTQENWRSAIRVIRYLGGYQPQEMLDLLRLMKRTGSFEDAPDYAEYVENADKLRFPGEVTEVANLGVKSGKLDASEAFVRDALASAKLHETEDRAGMAAMEARASSPAATPAVINAAADVLQSYGMAAKAEALYNVALTKPGLDTQRLLTRLGMAQLDQGKYADAQATFAKITGQRQPLAALLSLYTAQKAKGG